MTELPPLPAVTADETTTLVEFLDYFRAVFLRKVEGLDDAQARVCIPPSTMDLLGLARHVALVEQWWFVQVFTGSSEPDVWSDPDDPDIDWHHTPNDTIAEAIDVLRLQADRARRIVAGEPSLDRLTAIEVGPADRRERRSLRWILVHMIEEYARHCGHADLLREVVDGTTGD